MAEIVTADNGKYTADSNFITADGYNEAIEFDSAGLEQATTDRELESVTVAYTLEHEYPL